MSSGVCLWLQLGPSGVGRILICRDLLVSILLPLFERSRSGLFITSKCNLRQLFLHKFYLFFTSYGILSSKLYNIRLPVLIGTVSNITDAVRTVKVCIFNFCVSFLGWVYPYNDRFLVVCTVSEVDLNLQDGCLCLCVLRNRDSTRKRHHNFIEMHPNILPSPKLGILQRYICWTLSEKYMNFSFLQCLLYFPHIAWHNNYLQT